MRLRDGMEIIRGGGPRRPSLWRFFPLALIAAMSVVFAVNGVMVYFALDTFPGQAGSDGFDLSNHYDQVIDAMHRTATLGWKFRADSDAAGHPVVMLTDGTGAPLAGAEVAATAERPLGAPDTTRVRFHDAGEGRYAADTALTMPGQWELQVSAHAQGHDVATTKRIVIR